jgi:Ca-activated chloride channel family protein
MIRVLTADEWKDLGGDQADAGFGSIETARGCLPLTALKVDVNIEGMAAETTIQQRFRNVFDEPLEATYIFPLPPRAAVTGFRMTVNDLVVEGRIDERGKAREDYDTAIAEGRTASIAEQERADVFTLRVGNIPPKSTALIELILVAPVAIDSLEATYRFPLVVAPRYCPGVAIDGDPVGDGIAADTDLVPDASRISPPVLLPGFTSPVHLGIRVRIAAEAIAAAADGGAGSLGCTLPAKEDRAADGSLTVTVVPGQRLDRDFILRFPIAADSVATTTVLVEPDAGRPIGLGKGTPAEAAPGDGTFSVVIVPPAQAADVKQVPRDVVFMLDRSGSMGGWKMVAARRAVARMVDSLTADDRVAVMAFDNSVEGCGETPHLAAATNRHRWSVLEWLGGIEARGGTELVAAIKAGFRLFEPSDCSPSPGGHGVPRDRVFVLVTDCQVGDEDRVIANLVKTVADVKLFVVGIDTAINEGLLTRIADSTGGMAEMVESEDRLDMVMERISQRLATPLVSGLAIQSAGLDIIPESIVPAKLPNLVPGVPLVVRGRYRGTPNGGVCVVGRRPAGDTWRELAGATPASTGCHGSLWARGRLQHLEDVSATSDSDTELLSRQMVDLSTAFGVLCRFTAIVAIDPRDPDRTQAPQLPRRIVQPVELVGAAAYCLFARPSRTISYLKSSRAPRNTLDSFGDCAFFTPPSPHDRLHALGMRVVELLSKIRPRSGAVADIKPGKIRSLLKAVIALLKDLGACGAPRETIESVATAYGRLYALPTDPDAIVAMFDALADMGESASAVDRWWRAASVDPSTPGNFSP